MFVFVNAQETVFGHDGRKNSAASSSGDHHYPSHRSKPTNIMSAVVQRDDNDDDDALMTSSNCDASGDVSYDGSMAGMPSAWHVTNTSGFALGRRSTSQASRSNTAFPLTTEL